MAWKSQQRESREVEQLRGYQWEFLRRNPEYRDDYDQFARRFGKWFEKYGFWYERDRQRTTEQLVFFYNDICPVLHQICQRWHITDPFPPDWTFDKRGGHEYAPRRRVPLPTWYTAEAVDSLWGQGPVEAVKHKGRPSEAFSPRLRSWSRRRKRKTQNQQLGPQLLQLKLDVTRPQRELWGEVLKAIRFHRKVNADSTQQPKVKVRHRRRLDQYPLYLRVWDLRQAGLSFVEIAQQVYPAEYASHPRRRNPLVQRAMDHYARAKELIFGGYMELA